MFLLGIGGWIAIGVVVLLIILLIIFFVSTYNKLVKGRNKVKNQFSQIDVQLKRRFDLIPNLVETVKAYASHEKDILEKFAAARTMYQQASSNSDVEGMAKADAKLTSGFNALVNAVREQYPDLQANQNFQKLMAELTDTENKISYQRQFYNDVVLSYNNAREVFPSVIVANMFGFKEEKFFQADEESRQNVKVQF
ncbi:lemA family protein [Firmicutes bacterium CAG:449]|nr:lemA family protein [Firmicutes bacterium CAG:449]